jgi:hypothetical protein
MPVNKITDPDIVQKYVRVEWRHLDEEAQRKRCELELADEHVNSLGHAIRTFEEKAAEYIEYERSEGETDEHIMRQSLGFHIYGNGGWNRYYVRANGDICISESHADEAGLLRAIDHGFDLWG